MYPFHRIKIRSYEVGLHFRDGEFKGLLPEGRYWLFDPLGKVRVDVASQRAPWLAHEKLDVIVKSGALAGRAEVVDLKDYQRALVWIDGRFSHVLPPGLYAYWTGSKDVRVEIVDARKVRFQHADFKMIVRSAHAAQVLDICTVDRSNVGVSFQDGEYVETLPPGEYAFWRNVATSKVVEVDLREQTLDIAGQDIMTAEGTPDVAPLAGTITSTSYQAGAAGYYAVEHTLVGFDFMFAHCEAATLAVGDGQAVAAGQTLCLAGQTGDATAPHLHFEMWVGGWYAPGGHTIDPLPYLEAWEQAGR